MNEYLIILLLFITGIIASFLNSLAGGGSTLSLPIFFLLGLPVDVCNGTNRFGILFGNIASANTLRKGKQLDGDVVKRVALPLSLGSLIGATFIVGISEIAFQILLIGVLLFSVMQNLFLKPGQVNENPPSIISQRIAFFLIGLYGGFVQAGMGFVLIAGLRWMGVSNPTRVNAAKSFLSIFLVALSLVPFAFHHAIDFKLAMVFGAGTLLGGFSGAKLQMKFKGNWVRWFTTVVSLALIVKFCFSLFRDL